MPLHLQCTYTRKLTEYGPVSLRNKRYQNFLIQNDRHAGNYYFCTYLLVPAQRMSLHRITFFSLALITLSVRHSHAQTSSADLRIEGLAGNSVTVTAAEFSKLPRTEFRGKDHDGQEHTYTGVPVAALLSRVDAPMGAQLRGRALASYLLAEAVDGYRVVFALPELDSIFTKQVIFVADRRDGQPLPDQQGPYRIVVPQETKQARWIRQLTVLKVKSATD